MSAEQVTNPELRVGCRVADTYTLERVLGIGAVGAVYEARHSVTSRRVAVKIIDEALVAMIPTLCARFVREAQAAAAVQHDGIVKILDAGEEASGMRYLVFEYLEGETFEDALQRQEVSAERVVRIGIQALEALDAAHAAGFIHRDVKPENIFLVSTPGLEAQAKILDFGVAKPKREIVESVLTALGSIVGTLRYMSPEQAGGGHVDERSDLWSLGATLFRAFSGRAPHLGETPLEMLARTTGLDVVPLASLRPDLPSELCAAIDRSLARDPEARWPTILEMRDALRACLVEVSKDRSSVTEAGAALPSFERAEPTMIVHRSQLTHLPVPKRWFAAWAVVAILVAFLIVGFAVFRDLPPEDPVQEIVSIAAASTLVEEVAPVVEVAPVAEVARVDVEEVKRAPRSSTLRPRKKIAATPKSRRSDRLRHRAQEDVPRAVKEAVPQAEGAIREYY